MDKKGFTILEMIVAIFVLTVGLIAMLSLMHRAIFAAELFSSRLKAAYLAQEGLEIVRNIRDSNWLAQRTNPALPWDNNLEAGDREADYNDSFLTPFLGRDLRIDSSGFYNYDSGTATKYQRKINIQNPGPGILKVLVQITWQERGAPYSLSVYGDIYNWR